MVYEAGRSSPKNIFIPAKAGIQAGRTIDGYRLSSVWLIELTELWEHHSADNQDRGQKGDE